MPLLARLTSFMLLLIALVPTTTALIVDTPDGWNIVVMTANDSALLTRALTNESNYATDVDVPQRVCVYEIHSAAQLVSADAVIRRYNVQACPVNSAQSAGLCAKTVVTTDGSCGEYTIHFVEQTATNSLQVRAVTLIRTQADESKKASMTPAPLAAT